MCSWALCPRGWGGAVGSSWDGQEGMAHIPGHTWKASRQWMAGEHRGKGNESRGTIRDLLASFYSLMAWWRDIHSVKWYFTVRKGKVQGLPGKNKFCITLHQSFEFSHMTECFWKQIFNEFKIFNHMNLPFKLCSTARIPIFKLWTMLRLKSSFMKQNKTKQRGHVECRGVQEHGCLGSREQQLSGQSELVLGGWAEHCGLEMMECGGSER